MTGYAQARQETTDLSLRVSVKSVNHRFLDLKMRMPEGLEIYEPRLRQVVRDHIHRGHVEIQIAAEPRAAGTIQVNQELAKAYLRAAEVLRRESLSTANVDVVALMRLPGVISGLGIATPENEESREQLGGALEECLRQALNKLDEMRRTEGKHLVEEMQQRLNKIGDEADQVRVLAEKLRPAFARRLDARLKELLGGSALDPARVAQEAAILAERSDISEELERLRSHLAQFGSLLQGAGEMGKKLDFLLQEMHREANTMLSKTPGVDTEALCHHRAGARNQIGHRKIARAGSKHRMSDQAANSAKPDPLVIIVSGPSGSGKSTLVQRVLELPGTMPSISCTTRARRATEASGKCYDFVSDADFEAMIAPRRIFGICAGFRQAFLRHAEKMAGGIAPDRARPGA